MLSGRPVGHIRAVIFYVLVMFGFFFTSIVQVSLELTQIMSPLTVQTSY